MILDCRRCGNKVAFEVKIGFRALCPECSAYLHSCSHCRFLDKGTSRCLEPMAEKVRDLETGNFCDYFSPAYEESNAGNTRGSGDRNEAEDLWKKLTGKP